ncbi:MAG: hypothetical protein U0L72_03360 [Acutalibacteraceae bacterium]|nr:hypothetical protein [Acutalibacteraceae bacterium]
MIGEAQNAVNPDGFTSILTKPQQKILVPKSDSSLNALANRCVAGRPIKSALVRSQYRIGLCPKMKYPPLCGGIFIQAHLKAEDTKTSLVFLKANQRFSRCISTIPQGNAYHQNEVFGKVAQIQSKYKF